MRMMKELDNVIRKYEVMLVIESVDVWPIQETRKIFIFQKHSTMHFMEHSSNRNVFGLAPRRSFNTQYEKNSVKGNEK